MFQLTTRLLLFWPITDLAVSDADLSFDDLVEAFSDAGSDVGDVRSVVDAVVGDSMVRRCWPRARSSSMIQSTSRKEFSLLRSVSRSMEKSRNPFALIFIFCFFRRKGFLLNLKKVLFPDPVASVNDGKLKKIVDYFGIFLLSLLFVVSSFTLSLSLSLSLFPSAFSCIYKHKHTCSSRFTSNSLSLTHKGKFLLLFMSGPFSPSQSYLQSQFLSLHLSLKLSLSLSIFYILHVYLIRSLCIFDTLSL